MARIGRCCRRNIQTRHGASAATVCPSGYNARYAQAPSIGNGMISSKTAIVTGVTGEDGAYRARGLPAEFVGAGIGNRSTCRARSIATGPARPRAERRLPNPTRR